MKKRTLALIVGLTLTGSSLLAISLQEAAYLGFTEGVEDLIKKGANVNEVNEDGFTPLHAAGLTCRTEIVKILLDAGANPTKGDLRNKQTAIDMAIEQSDFLQKLKEQLALAQEMKEKGESELLILRIKNKDFLVGDNQELIELVTIKEEFLKKLKKTQGKLHFAEQIVLDGCEATINLLIEATD